MDSDKRLLYFAFFNEIGIIAQLSRVLLEAGLPQGLIAPHFSVLNHLIRVKDGQTPQALARAFQVPKTSMTHTLAILVKRNLIEMRPNLKDGRSKRVWLTEEGRTLREQAIASLNPDIDKISREIPPETLSELLPALAEIRQTLDAYRDASGED